MGKDDIDQWEREQDERRERRQHLIECFTVVQRCKRQWIALPDLALFVARAGATTTASAYRHVAELLRLGELSDAAGRSRVLFLDLGPYQIPGQHRLSPAIINGAIWAEEPIETRSGAPELLGGYSEADFVPGRLVVVTYLERAWLARGDARRTLERLGLAWPLHFDPERGSAIANGAKPLGSIAKAEAQTNDWLRRLMETEERPKRKKECRKEAMERFRVSGRAFDRAWDSAVRATGKHDWSRAGRKSMTRVPAPTLPRGA